MANARPRPLSPPAAAPSGATAPQAPPVLPEGHVALAAPSGATAVSWQGVEYPVQAGVLVVPEGAEGELASHGFTRKEV